MFNENIFVFLGLNKDVIKVIFENELNIILVEII